jgi:RNA polymerase sigma factor (sigma-70 family)
MPNSPQQSLRALPGHGASSQPPRPERELVELVLAARAGDSSAWTKLIDRFDRILRSIARSYRLAPEDVDDVVQATWLDLLQDIERLREPAAIAGWLATATRRKAMRLLQVRVREHLTDDPGVSDRPDLHGPEASVLASERRAVLARALATLPDRHRRLMTLLLTQPMLDYREISDRLAMPVGSIGPIRARSLARLSRHPQLRALREEPTTGPGAIGCLSAAVTKAQ